MPISNPSIREFEMNTQDSKAGKQEFAPLDDQLPIFSEFMSSLLEAIKPVAVLTNGRRRERSELDQYEKRLADLFHTTVQVHAAFENIGKSIRYISTPSRRPSDIKSEEHIKYHFECALQSMYILREKMTMVLPQICKLQDRWLISEDFRKEHRRILNILKKWFAGVSQLRAAIVHLPHGFRDPDLEGVEIFSILHHAGHDNFSEHYNEQLAVFKIEKIKGVRGLQSQASEYIEALFKYLLNQFVSDGKLELPMS